MASKKTYIILFIVLAIFTGGVFYLGFTYESDYLTVVADPSFKAKFNGQKWTRITEGLSKIEKGYSVYDETGSIGEYSVSHLSRNNRWFIYDEEMNEISKTGSVVAFKSNLKYNVTDFKPQEITDFDKEYIDKILKDNKIDTDTELSINYKYYLDLNGDGKDDEIIVSNLYQDARNNSDAYGMAIAIIKNKVYTLHFSGKKEDVNLTVMHANLSSVFDIEGNKNKYVLISTSSFGVSNSCVALSEMTKEGPIKKISC